MRWLFVRIEAHIVVLPPLVVRAAEQVGDVEATVPVEPQSPACRARPWPRDVERIQVDDDEHGVVVRRGDGPLGKDEQLRVVGAVNSQVAQPMQRHVLAANVVEPGQVAGQAPAGRFCGRVVARPQLVLLRVEILLAAGRSGVFSNSS